jgi:hypothetical protein
MARPTALRRQPLRPLRSRSRARPGADSGLLHRTRLASRLRRKLRRQRCYRLALSYPSVHRHGRIAGRHPHPHGAHRHAWRSWARTTSAPPAPRASARPPSSAATPCPTRWSPSSPSSDCNSAHLLAGAIVTETIFSWPGLGRLTVSAISNRDYALVQGCLLVHRPHLCAGQPAHRRGLPLGQSAHARVRAVECSPAGGCHRRRISALSSVVACCFKNWGSADVGSQSTARRTEGLSRCS